MPVDLHALMSMDMASPSHQGASSGVFGGVSNRFHMSEDYPFHIQVPFFDLNTAW